MEIVFRDCEFSDSHLMCKWRNSVDVRLNSKNQHEISSDEHLDWFKGKLERKLREPFWAVEMDGQTVGFLRFEAVEVNSSIFEISIVVDPELRGQGIGTLIIELGILKLAPSFPKTTIRAYIRSSNIVSKKIFLKNGFSLSASKEDFDQYFLIL